MTYLWTSLQVLPFIPSSWTFTLNKICKYVNHQKRIYVVFVRGHQQRTFIMPYRLCQLSKTEKAPCPTPPPPPLFLMNNMIKLDGTTTKNIWKINTVFTFYFKFCEGISHIKNVWDTATSSFICCFTSIFTSADIQHYLEKDFHHDFSFFNRFTQNSHLPFIPLVMLMP